MTGMPMVVHGADQPATSVRQVRPSERLFDEAWLQSLIHDNPELLPCSEIDSDFGRLVPLGREIPVASGAIDLLFATPNGRLCLVETKLWRNPEAHRTVLAQVMDYAKDLARMEYEDLSARVRQSLRRLGNNADGIYHAVRSAAPGNELDEVAFEEAMRRTLRTGDFLLLIAGDRIRPEVAMLADVLRSAPQLEFRVGLVELRVYRLTDSDWPLLIVPDVVGRTHEITRGVVRIRYEHEKPEVTVAPDVTTTTPGRTDLETFLKSVPAGMEDAYRLHLDKWISTGPPYLVYWGSSGFSLRLLAGARYQTVFDAYPGYVSVFKREWMDRWNAQAEAFQRYRDRVSGIGAFVAILSTGKRYVRHEDLTPEELQTALAATSELADELARHPR
ncbi:MAG: hypothetical protein Q8P50_14515 [Bacillota bacterium]|nr:hypothetical protein [Bacillota bacterium]